METLSTILMGIVEGITEFLPISSTGHLILTGNLLGFEKTIGGKELNDAFEIIIQLGAILAVVAAFPERFTRLLRFKDNRGMSGLRGLTLLAITSIPMGTIGLLAHKKIEAHLMGRPLVVAVALAVGAIWIAAVERYRPQAKTVGLDSMTWKEALSMGLFQCMALWPGMSRSASTILGGMMSRVDRKTAAEYSFLAAVPIMLAATGLKLREVYHHLDAAHAQLFLLGFVIAFFSAWATVKAFVYFLSRYTLMPFAWYRLVISAAVLWWMVYRVQYGV